MNWKKNLGTNLLILVNFVFWIGMYLAWFSIYWDDQPIYDPHFQGELKGGERYYFFRALLLTVTAITPFVLAIYGNWLWLLPKYLAKKRYWRYCWRLVVLLSFLAIFLSFHPSFYNSEAWLMGKDSFRIEIPAFIKGLYALFMITIFTKPLYFSYHWFQQNAQLADLRNEKLQTELSFLKSQINPHFFFNTLNNLYALTLENSTAAPKVILKLSDLMRYTIYDGRDQLVFLEQEVAFIENYIELQKIRLHKKTSITFAKNISEPKRQIPPLLFVVFLENAFKHGVETLRNDAIVDLQLTEKNGLLKFYCLNNYDYEERMINDGLGLENIRRRLRLLFQDNYKLEIVDQEATFRVYLTINLNQ